MASNGIAPPRMRVSLTRLSKMIDHSLLHPTMTDDDLVKGFELALKYNVATACIKPYAIPLAKQYLAGTSVAICPVIAFPQGNSSTAVKVFEAEDACKMLGPGACKRAEIDMVVNIGKVLGHDWEYIEREIKVVNDSVTRHGAKLKVIFENDFLSEVEIKELCHICTRIDVAFVKTSTGYGFVKQKSGEYSYKGATHEQLRLMRRESGQDVQIKAAGGVRTLDDLLVVMSLGVTRIGATATESMLEEARKRGIGDEEVEVEVPHTTVNGKGGY